MGVITYQWESTNVSEADLVQELEVEDSARSENACVACVVVLPLVREGRIRVHWSDVSARMCMTGLGGMNAWRGLGGAHLIRIWPKDVSGTRIDQ